MGKTTLIFILSHLCVNGYWVANVEPGTLTSDCALITATLALCILGWILGTWILDHWE